MLLLQCKIIHRELAKRDGFEYANKYWDHYPQPVIQNDSIKILWNFTVQTKVHVLVPDIICVDFIKKHAFLIDIAIQGDSHIPQKINEKYQRYTDLKIEAQKMWSMITSVVL